VPARTSRQRPRDPSELRAARWYRRRGYRVLDANVWAAGYELDLVVRRGRVVAFCEVKAKRGEGWGDPLEMVTPEKARRVRVAAGAWLQAHPALSGLRLRFDVIVERQGRLEHFAGAF
jgi:putative endonuclease